MLTELSHAIDFFMRTKSWNLHFGIFAFYVLLNTLGAIIFGIIYSGIDGISCHFQLVQLVGELRQSVGGLKITEDIIMSTKMWWHLFETSDPAYARFNNPPTCTNLAARTIPKTHGHTNQKEELNCRTAEDPGICICLNFHKFCWKRCAVQWKCPTLAKMNKFSSSNGLHSSSPESKKDLCGCLTRYSFPFVIHSKCGFRRILMESDSFVQNSLARIAEFVKYFCAKCSLLWKSNLFTSN